MPCGKEHEEKKAEVEDEKKREEWEKKNPGCTPTIDKDCPHVHDIRPEK